MRSRCDRDRGREREAWERESRWDGECNQNQPHSAAAESCCWWLASAKLFAAAVAVAAVAGVVAAGAAVDAAARSGGCARRGSPRHGGRAEPARTVKPNEKENVKQTDKTQARRVSGKKQGGRRDRESSRARIRELESQYEDGTYHRG